MSSQWHITVNPRRAAAVIACSMTCRIHHIMAVVADDADVLAQFLKVVDCRAFHAARDGGALVDVDQANRSSAVQYVLHLFPAADYRCGVGHKVGRRCSRHGQLHGFR